MIKQIKYKNITWIDVASPTKEEISSLADKYDIHTMVHDELLHPSPRSKVDLYDDFIYLILHFPAENFFRSDIKDEDGTKEVDFILGKDYLITAHYEHILPLEEFSKILEASENSSGKKEKDIHAGYLFYYIIRQLYQSLEPGLDFINDNLKRVEQKIFSGHEKEMVRVLSEINHHLLDVKWSLKGHGDVLESLEDAAKEFYGTKFAYYTRSIIGEYKKVYSILENNEQTFTELRSTNESLLAIKTNETMKIIAAAAFVFLPITLIGTIFGMSGTEANMPIIKSDNGFFLTLGLMVVVAALMFILVKLKKWI